MIPRLKVFRFVVLASTFGTENEEGTGDWRNCIMRAAFVTTYYSGVKPRTMRWTAYETPMGQKTNRCVQDFGREI
jgi:hypothetical protein